MTYSKKPRVGAGPAKRPPRGSAPAVAAPVRRGRKPALGRFTSRADLCSYIWRAYLSTPASIAEIASAARVSDGVAHKILNSHEGKPVGAAPAGTSRSPGAARAESAIR